MCYIHTQIYIHTQTMGGVSWGVLVASAASTGGAHRDSIIYVQHVDIITHKPGGVPEACLLFQLLQREVGVAGALLHRRGASMQFHQSLYWHSIGAPQDHELLPNPYCSICMFVRKFVCMFVCIYVSVLSTCVCIEICVYVCMYVCMYVSIYVCMVCMCVYM